MKARVTNLSNWQGEDIYVNGKLLSPGDSSDVYLVGGDVDVKIEKRVSESKAPFSMNGWQMVPESRVFFEHINEPNPVK